MNKNKWHALIVNLFSFREEYLAKIEKRIKDYKIEILNEPRPGKKLLVLDIDYTLFGKWNPVDVIGAIDHDRMVVGFTTTCATSAYYH